MFEITDKPVLLIDADIVLYQICASREQEIFWGEDEYGHDLFTLHSSPKDCLRGITSRIEQFKKDFKTDQVILVFSGKENFRYDIYSDYKANRKGKRKPLGLGYAKDQISKVYKAVSEPRLEADDVLALLATEPGETKRIIISIDKDFDTVPGFVHNPGKDKDKPGVCREISKEKAKFNFYKQILEGDKADHYKGLPGVGPVSAVKILEKEGDMLQNMLDAFAKKKYNKEYVLIQARMARLLQWGEYNWKTKEIKLWNI